MLHFPLLLIKRLSKSKVGIISSDYESVHKMRTHQTGLNRKSAILLNGTEIDSLNRNEWSVLCRDYTEIVLSRMTPKQKLRCVKEFQSAGLTVLFAGDGANDVPALRAANLSVG